MIHITQNIVESPQSNYEILELLLSWFTWFLTAFFAAKSFFLEKKIWKLNFFYWKWFITKMETYPTNKNYLRIMFINTSNVVGYIDSIAIEIEPISYISRIRIRIVTSDIRKRFWIDPVSATFFMPLRPFINKEENSIFKNEYPPYKVLPQESKAIFIWYKDFEQNMNEELKKHKARIRRFVFLTSSWTKIYANVSKKILPDLIFSKNDLEKTTA